MPFKIGLVGKPSAGKSTFFKAATLAEVPIAAYPFTTIDPNIGVGYIKVKDPAQEFNKVSNPREGFVLKEFRFIPVQLVDVAGLVPGAHEGKGMGNKFLSDLNEADVLIHVVDASGSTNEKGEATDNHDPCKDILFLEEELDLWYLNIMKKGWDKIVRVTKAEKGEIHEALAKHLSSFRLDEEQAAEVIQEIGLDKENYNHWTDEEFTKLAVALRKKTKPIIIAANKIDLPNAKENIAKMQEQFPHLKIVPCAGDLELALRMAAKAGVIDYVPGENNFELKKEVNPEQQKALDKIKKIMDEFGATGVQTTLDASVFDFLKYMAIFPGGASKLEDSKGNVLPDCFLMPPESTALDFAYKLHTDFGKHFLYAINVRTKQRIGKEHKLKHLDVIEIVHAAK